MSPDQDLFGGNFELVFTEAELDVERGLRRPIKAGIWGGAQRLARTIQLREREGHAFLTAPELDDAYYYGWGFGDGTYQSAYFRTAVAAARRAGWEPSLALIERTTARRDELLSRRGRAWDGSSDAATDPGMVSGEDRPSDREPGRGRGGATEGRQD